VILNKIARFLLSTSKLSARFTNKIQSPTIEQVGMSYIFVAFIKQCDKGEDKDTNKLIKYKYK